MGKVLVADDVKLYEAPTGPTNNAELIARELETPHPELSALFGEISNPKKRAYLVALTLTPNLQRASDIAGISSMTGYLWRTKAAETEEDEAFQDAVDIARSIAVERAESEAWRRAIEGIEKPIFGSLGSDPNTGKSLGTGQIGSVTEYSDNLTMFMLKGHRPEKYRERFEHSGPNGGPIEVQAIDPRALSSDTLQRILEEAKRNQLPASTEIIEASVTAVNESVDTE